MTIGERIKERRKELNMSQEELAHKVGYAGKSVVSKLENGDCNVNQTMIVKYAEALNVSPTFLLLGEESPNNIPQYDNIFPIELKKFRLLGEIACGEPIFADEDRESYIMAGADIKADFCLTCKGDSMIGARIYDGDIVFIREQPTVENGEIAAVIIGEDVTLKRVSYFPEKNMLILKAENSKYNDLIYTNEELSEIRILGKAVAFQSDVI